MVFISSIKEKLKKSTRAHSQDGIISNLIIKRISILITSALVRTNITPNQVTLLSLLVALTGAFFLALGSWKYVAIGGFLAFFSFILDFVDGEIARFKGMCSKRGGFLDGVVDRFSDSAIVFGMCLGLYRIIGSHRIWILGFILLTGIFMTVIVSFLGTSELTLSGLKNFTNDISKTVTRKFSILKYIKPSYFALTKDIRLFIIMVGGFTNQILWALIILMVLQNLFWICLVILIWIKGKNDHLIEE